MREPEIFKLIERISNVLRSEQRKKYAVIGLQPIHGQVMEYLARCNKYSNTHASVADYLGLTKGTVSQTIQLLERKRYLDKTVDSIDGRVVHLTLTRTGQALVESLKPLESFRQAETLMGDQSFDNLDHALSDMLALLQQTNQSKSFGLCHSCQHFGIEQQHYLCRLSDETLVRDDVDKICRNHAAKPHS
ncbi:MAG: winged helix-turn-helix transcriptional regulator [Methylomonas sp.]|nr:winged helix-turn-helix transcriptional regulator [Methylomonas sp.]PPD22204.1 MAG: MarR family transcriptional regulator [Methylomonas sp.]PPD27741.1 MAG: MarR family transcriptional regulator [Methylomonas sp.]PPD39752.1 MAG: MarR family transcriptional regulator [Methylomonas sp.]PPD42525.1 MAG: MarR family transcriptional regulator [Methylomonas sp.]